MDFGYVVVHKISLLLIPKLLLYHFFSGFDPFLAFNSQTNNPMAPSSNPARSGLHFFFFFFFSRATDQQYGIRTFEDNSKLHGHTNEHVQLIRRGTSRD